MKIIGMTGPSGSGKTCALKHLEQKGVKVIDADYMYHELLRHNLPMLDAIKARFGITDRKQLGEIVFADNKALGELERITHPFVIDEIKYRLDTYRSLHVDMAAIEAIALFESELASLCDGIILITADRDKLVDRITARDSVSREYAEARLNNRIFSNKATFVIHNNGDIANLYSQIDEIYTEVIL